MITVISESTPRAIKDHNCDACDWLLNSCIIYEQMLTFSEYRAVVKAKRNKWRIKKGEIYKRQFNRSDDIYTFKAIPEIHEICLKYDLYEV